MLVEDNALNRELALEILKEAGFTVDTAEDGEIAVQKMKQAAPGQYDLILMDIQMPKMDGYEATRQIRALPDAAKADIPIFALTANAFEDDRQNALKAGMDGHIAKPPVSYTHLTPCGGTLRWRSPRRSRRERRHCSDKYRVDRYRFPQ